MAVRDMMDHLPDSPSIGTVWSVQLFFRKAGNGSAHLFGRGRDFIY
jgi:hypothetical protein